MHAPTVDDRIAARAARAHRLKLWSSPAHLPAAPPQELACAGPWPLRRRACGLYEASRRRPLDMRKQRAPSRARAAGRRIRVGDIGKLRLPASITPLARARRSVLNKPTVHGRPRPHAAIALTTRGQTVMLKMASSRPQPQELDQDICNASGGELR